MAPGRNRRLHGLRPSGLWPFPLRSEGSRRQWWRLKTSLFAPFRKNPERVPAASEGLDAKRITLDKSGGWKPTRYGLRPPRFFAATPSALVGMTTCTRVGPSPSIPFAGIRNPFRVLPARWPAALDSSWTPAETAKVQKSYPRSKEISSP